MRITGPLMSLDLQEKENLHDAEIASASIIQSLPLARRRDEEVAAQSANTAEPTHEVTLTDGTRIRLAWNRGLKTTYYLRSPYLRLRPATHAEKSTLKSSDGRLDADPTCDACRMRELLARFCGGCFAGTAKGGPIRI